MENTIKILVVDDEEALCDGLAFNLETDGYIGTAANLRGRG